MLAGSRDHFLKHMYADGEVCDIMTRGFNSPDELDQNEKTRFTCFMIEQVLQMQDIMERHDAKLVTDIDYLAWLDWTCMLFRTPGGRNVWPQISSVTTSTINGILNTHLRENPDAPSVLEVMPVFDRRDSLEPMSKR